MSDWITDREPTQADGYGAGLVWIMDGDSVGVVYYKDVLNGRPWQPIVPPEPYVKAKRYEVRGWSTESYFIFDLLADNYATTTLPTREAAERIAAIYEEVMP